jgi:hypothetical protein
MFLKRVRAFQSNLDSAYLDDLEATSQERLLFFEKLALQRKQATCLKVE